MSGSRWPAHPAPWPWPELTPPLVHVLLHLGLPERARAARVCRAWRAELCASRALWRELDLRACAAPGEALRALARARPSDRAAAAAAVATHARSLTAEFAVGALRTEHLRWLPERLEHLNLNGVRTLGDDALDVLTRRCPALRRLELYWNTRITNAALRLVGARLPRLVHLNVSGCKHLSAEGVRLLCANTAARRGRGRLRFVDLTRVVALDDGALASLVAAHRGLRALNLYACGGLGDDALAACGAHLRQLRALDVCGSATVTDAGVAALAAGCPALCELNMTWCGQLTDHSLRCIAEGCRALTLLGLFGLAAISDVGVRCLARAPLARSLRTLDVGACCGVSFYRDRAVLCALFPRVTCWVHHC